MYCRFCGKEIENDSLFCEYCGQSRAKKSEASTQETRIELPLEKEEKDNERVGRAVASGVFFIVSLPSSLIGIFAIAVPDIIALLFLPFLLASGIFSVLAFFMGLKAIERFHKGGNKRRAMVIWGRIGAIGGGIMLTILSFFAVTGIIFGIQAI